MSFDRTNIKIKAPRVFVRKSGQTLELRVIGTIKKTGERIAVNDKEPFENTSNVLYPGYIIPPGDKLTETEEGGVRGSEIKEEEELPEIIAKISAGPPLNGNLMREVKILSRLSDLEGFPRVIARGKVGAEGMYWKDKRLLDFEKEVPFFVMPKIPGADLNKFTLSWGPDLKREKLAFLVEKALPSLAEKLANLHARNLVHRDIKPNNILLEENTASVTVLDFGRANWLEGTMPRTDVGTFGHYPPELIIDEIQAEDVRTDVYGFGVTCFEILTGREGILYHGMTNLWELTWVDFLCRGKDEYMRDYYKEVGTFKKWGFGELLKQLDMPPELKKMPLGEYLLKLFHPDKEQRPFDMGQVAEELRKIGGQLSQYELVSRQT